MNYSSISMFGLRRAFFFLMVLTVALFEQGCASTETPKVKDDITSLKAQVRDLQKRASDLELDVSSQKNEIVMLSERLKVSGNANDANGNFSAKEGSRVLRFKNIEPEEIYKSSIVFFNQGDYESALDGFGYIVRRYPGAKLGPKAQYWIGEVYYSKKRFARAVEEYRKALVRFPKSEKTPDVMFKIGLSRLALGLNEEGEKTLKELIEKYPDSAAASAAMDKLKEINPVVE